MVSPSWKYFAAILLALSLTGPASAGSIYGGLGMNFNHLRAETSDHWAGQGYQLFAGYHFGALLGHERIDWMLEGGYFNSGSFGGRIDLGGIEHVAAEGYWVSGVLDVRFGEMGSFLFRGGYDLGNDEGLLAGIGLGLRFEERYQIRTEVVGRQTVDSLQVNFTIDF